MSESLETLKKAEDKVAKALEALTDLERWVVYQTLYNQGLRIADAPHRIRALVSEGNP